MPPRRRSDPRMPWIHRPLPVALSQAGRGSAAPRRLGGNQFCWASAISHRCCLSLGGKVCSPQPHGISVKFSSLDNKPHSSRPKSWPTSCTVSHPQMSLSTMLLSDLTCGEGKSVHLVSGGHPSTPQSVPDNPLM